MMKEQLGEWVSSVFQRLQAHKGEIQPSDVARYMIEEAISIGIGIKV